MNSIVMIRAISYLGLMALIYCFYLYFPLSELHSSSTINEHLSSLSVLMTLVVGVTALVRYYSRPNALFLLLGAGFLALSGVEIYQSLRDISLITPIFETLTPQSSLQQRDWVSNRLYLALCFIGCLWYWWRRQSLGFFLYLKPTTAYLFVGVVTILWVAFFSVMMPAWPHWEIANMAYPQEALPGGLFLIALIGFLMKKQWYQSQFDHWLILALILNVSLHFGFKAYAVSSTDSRLTVAFSMQLISYAFIVFGLLLNLYEEVVKPRSEMSEDSGPQELGSGSVRSYYLTGLSGRLILISFLLMGVTAVLVIGSAQQRLDGETSQFVERAMKQRLQETQDQFSFQVSQIQTFTQELTQLRSIQDLFVSQQRDLHFSEYWRSSSVRPNSALFSWNNAHIYDVQLYDLSGNVLYSIGKNSPVEAVYGGLSLTSMGINLQQLPDFSVLQHPVLLLLSLPSNETLWDSIMLYPVQHQGQMVGYAASRVMLKTLMASLSRYSADKTALWLYANNQQVVWAPLDEPLVDKEVNFISGNATSTVSALSRVYKWWGTQGPLLEKRLKEFQAYIDDQSQVTPDSESYVSQTQNESSLTNEPIMSSFWAQRQPPIWFQARLATNIDVFTQGHKHSQRLSLMLLQFESETTLWGVLLPLSSASGLAAWIVFGCLSLCIVFCAVSLTAPLRYMVFALRNYSHGQQETPLPVTAGGEIGDLAINLKSLQSSLKRRTEEWWEREREVHLLQECCVFEDRQVPTSVVLTHYLTLLATTYRWSIGHIYQVVDGNSKSMLIPTEEWYFDDEQQWRIFKSVTANTVLESGEDLPGKVIARRKICWVKKTFSRIDGLPRPGR